jgi:hypothetical protein
MKINTAAGRTMRPLEIKQLRAKLKQFEKLMLEAGHLSEEIKSYADCYSPLQHTQGALVRSCAEFLGYGASLNTAYAARYICETLIEMQKLEQQSSAGSEATDSPV